jgi:hypothetical protein
MKVGFNATQVRRLLPAVKINNRTGADRPEAGISSSSQRTLQLARHVPQATLNPTG